MFNDRPRPSVSATESGDNLEAIEQYVQSIKKRARDSNSTQDKTPRRPQLWMLPVPVHSFYVSMWYYDRVTKYFTGRNGEYPRGELTKDLPGNA
jgi:hypothetical protein